MKVQWYQDDKGKWFYETPEPVSTKGGPFDTRREAQAQGYADILAFESKPAKAATTKKADDAG